MGLGFVLTAVPSLSPTWRAAFGTIAIRALAVLAGAVLAVLTVGHPAALAAVTVAAAVGGGLLARVGPTAALAVVLVAVDVPDDGGAERLLPYVAGALVVAVAWTAWFGCAEMLRRRRGAAAPASPAAERGWRESWPHAVRVGVAVAVAVSVAGLLPEDGRASCGSYLGTGSWIAVTGWPSLSSSDQRFGKHSSRPAA